MPARSIQQVPFCATSGPIRSREAPPPPPPGPGGCGHGGTGLHPATAAPGPAAPRTTFPGSAGRGPAGPGRGCWEGRCLACWLSGAPGREGLFGGFYCRCSRKGEAPQPNKASPLPQFPVGPVTAAPLRAGGRVGGPAGTRVVLRGKRFLLLQGCGTSEVGFGNHLFNLWFL